jgi:hypothetical protein
VLPDLRAVLKEEALRTRAVSSSGERSAMDRKCRGLLAECPIELVELKCLW